MADKDGKPEAAAKAPTEIAALPSSASEASLESRRDHAFRVLTYIQFFNGNAENRANYLLLANSIFLIGLPPMFGGVAKDLQPSNLVIVLAAISIVAFLVSVVLAIFAILPRTLDGGTPLNHEVIPAVSKDDYAGKMAAISDDEMIRDVALEIHVLCRVANDRFFFVTWSARILFLGIVSVASASIAAAVIHFL